MAHLRDLPDGPTELDRTWGMRPRFYEIFMADYSRIGGARRAGR